jgi:hypothetical protein
MNNFSLNGSTDGNMIKHHQITHDRYYDDALATGSNIELWLEKVGCFLKSKCFLSNQDASPKHTIIDFTDIPESDMEVR